MRKRKDTQETTHLEELLGWAAVEGAVLDLRLSREVVHGLDGSDHPLDGEEGR